jgi:hypothetical protein
MGENNMVMTQPLPAYAERLWIKLQSNLLDAYKAVIEIIETEAWKPTYDSFFDAWDDKMASISFAPQVRTYVAYQMFNEGRTPDDVADAVKGLTPDSAERLKEQKEHGVPPEHATTTVRRHQRKRPGEAKYLHLRVPHETLLGWRRIARENRRSVDDIALEAVTAAFEALSS